LKKLSISKIKRKHILLVIILALIILSLYVSYKLYKLDQLTGMTFEEMLEYTTKNNSEAIISVGIIDNNTVEYFSYGKNGSILETFDDAFEIGSISKTFTTALLSKALDEELLYLESSINNHIELTEKEHYPTILNLATHTSGYKSFYFEKPMIGNFLNRRNDFYGVTKESMIRRLNKISLKETEYSFKYSNFGIAVLGMVLENAYEKDFVELMGDYIESELTLVNTKVLNDGKDNSDFWIWKDTDAYIPAGTIISNIKDMTKYLSIHMNDELKYLTLSHQGLSQGKTSTTHERMNIRVDLVGLGWMIDMENGFIWHNGATDYYNSYIAFDINKEFGVVVLSNLPPNYRIPATMMGIRLMETLKYRD
jgi:CubicO group peptidase (beta-lactamase class C family)